ncbi:MAG: hypothetical protein QW540_07920 [Archaeoglobaceae archaeon]
MMERRVKLEEGKLALDLLIGLSIFLFTFIFIANFLPGVFADVRSEINLANQAYRVSSLLAEDPGFNSSWAEDVNLMNCNNVEFRPGLIVFSTSNPDIMKRKEYNHLNLSKIQKLAELLGDVDCRAKVKKFLGLDLTDYGSPISYRFTVSLKNLSGNLVTYNGNPLLNHGDQGTGSQVLKFERIVYLDTTVDNCDIIAKRCIAVLEVRVWI